VASQGAGAAERLTVGVAARLSRYLQVLTQARKMGKERISSQEISDYTNINATQIRRDLSVGAGRLGQAIASSSIFAEHGINIAAVFDTDPDKVGRPVGSNSVSPYDGLPEIVRDKNIIVGVLAVPADSAQRVADDLVAAGVKIVFNYSEALLDVPQDVQVHTSNPAVELLYALYFHLT
jgi:redox-sensing transcriptional repressor